MSTMLTKSKRDWEQFSKDWERSGLTQKEFCKQRGLRLSDFSNKRSQLKKRKMELSGRSGKESDFWPVAVETQAIKPTSVASPVLPEIEVELPFGVLLRFRGVQQR